MNQSEVVRSDSEVGGKQSVMGELAMLKFMGREVNLTYQRYYVS